MLILPDAQIALRLILRARFVFFGFCLALSLVGLGLMASQFSARQPASIALDVGISFIRLTLPLLVTVLIQDLIGREFERRYCLTSMTYPRARYLWLLARVLVVVMMCFVLLAILATILAGLVTYAGTTYDQSTPVALGVPYIITIGFVMVDLLVVAAFATLLSVSTTTPSFVLIGSIGFTLIARSYSTVISLLEQNSNLVADIADPGAYRSSLSLLHFLLPDLGGLDVRMIALYGKMEFLPGDWPVRLSSALLYTLLLLALSIWFLKRRDFS